MKEKDLWMKKLKERLENYSEPLPASGWEELEKELMHSSVEKRIIPFRNRWIMAAAAVALLAVVSSLSLYFWGTPDVDDIRYTQIPSLAVTPDVLPDVDLPDSNGQRISSIQRNSDRRLARTEKQEIKVNTESFSNESFSNFTNEETKIAETNINQHDISEKQIKKVVTEEPKIVEQRNKKRNKKKYLPSASTALNFPLKKSSGGKWSMGISVANSGGASSETQTGATGYSMSRVNMISVSNGLMDIPEGQTLVFEEGIPYLRQKSNAVDIKHHQPISFGLSVRRNLGKGFSLETGLTYTLLSSDAQFSGNERSVEQNLHYLGIPLRANWNFFDRRLFTFYVSGGGMIEKCIYGKIGSEKQTVKPLQFSLTGAIGAQVNVTRRLGIYAEPGVAYFFDDGSDMQTIRKETPLNFNIQAGLRFTY